MRSSVLQPPDATLCRAFVLQVVLTNVKGGLENNFFTETGFIYLQKLFVERGRIESTYVGADDGGRVSVEPNALTNMSRFFQLDGHSQVWLWQRPCAQA